MALPVFHSTHIQHTEITYSTREYANIYRIIAALSKSLVGPGKNLYSKVRCKVTPRTSRKHFAVGITLADGLFTFQISCTQTYHTTISKWLIVMQKGNKTTALGPSCATIVVVVRSNTLIIICWTNYPATKNVCFFSHGFATVVRIQNSRRMMSRIDNFVKCICAQTNRAEMLPSLLDRRCGMNAHTQCFLSLIELLMLLYANKLFKLMLLLMWRTFG